MWLDLAKDGFFFMCTDDARLLLAVLEHDQGRDAQYREPASGFRIVVYVHLHGLEASGVVAGDLFHHGRDHVAGDTPLGPEVHEDGPIGGQDLALEALVVYLYDVIR